MLKKISVELEPKLLREVDPVRGIVLRQRWIVAVLRADLDARATVAPTPVEDPDA